VWVYAKACGATDLSTFLNIAGDLRPSLGVSGAQATRYLNLAFSAWQV